MILAIDIGNTTVALGGIKDGRVCFVARMDTVRTRTAAEYRAEMDKIFAHRRHPERPMRFEGAVLTSVVPQITGALAEGGSTLTQQLAKNALFTQEKRMTRKAAEVFAAIDIEKNYTKQQIFEMYANTIYFGSGCYGIGEAAEGYFGKTADQLTDAEAIVLAGLPNAPSAYASSPERALKRAQVVLKRMVKCRVFTQQQADEVAAEVAALPILQG